MPRLRGLSTRRAPGEQVRIHGLTAPWKWCETGDRQRAGIIPLRFGRRDSSQEQFDRRVQARRQGHGLSRGPDRALDGAHPGAHGALEGARQRPPLAPRPTPPCWQATASAELPERHRRGALPNARRQARAQEIVGKKSIGRAPGRAGSALRSSHQDLVLAAAARNLAQQTRLIHVPSQMEVVTWQ